MKLPIAFLILLVCLTTPISGTAQDAVQVEVKAKVVLVAPLSARIGELVRFDATGSSADSYKWRLIPGSADFEAFAGGARAVFSARNAGTFQFVLAVAKAETVDVMVHTVKVLAPPQKPITNSLAEWIPFWNWASPMPPEECKALADSFEDIASQVEDLDDAKEWIKVTAKANRRVLGDRLDAWAPFLDRIGELLLKKAKSGALMTPEDHQKAWLEIAEGLRNCG